MEFHKLYLKPVINIGFLREGLRHFCLSSFRVFSEKASAESLTPEASRLSAGILQGTRPGENHLSNH